jgi:urea transport system permease protein
MRDSLSLVVALAGLLVGIPALYLTHAIDITTVNQLGRFLCIAIVALGIDLVWGYTGILSLCQAMFFCFGGYAIGMHMALHGPLDGEGIPRCLFVVTSEVSGFHLPWLWKPFASLPMAVALSVLLPGLAAFLFGYFAFRSRVRGVYFSIITQATTLGACLVFRRNETRLCGTNGLTNFVTLAGFDLRAPGTRLGLYFLTVLALAGVYVMCRIVVRSRLGRLMVAVRDNESRLRFSGYQPVTIKVFAFTLGAMIAGVGGMLYTPQNGIITPYKMDTYESILMVVLVAVGGRGTLTGAALGAMAMNYLYAIETSGTLLNLLPRPLRGIKMLEIALGPGGWPFVLGGLAIAIVLFFPDGLIGAWRSFMTRFKSVPDEAARGFAPATVGGGHA